MKYDIIRSRDNAKVNLNPDSHNVLMIDEGYSSQNSSQNSAIYSPMNLSRYQLPADTTEEMKNPEVLYQTQIFQDNEAIQIPRKDLERSFLGIGSQYSELMTVIPRNNQVMESFEVPKDLN